MHPDVSYFFGLYYACIFYRLCNFSFLRSRNLLHNMSPGVVSALCKWDLFCFLWVILTARPSSLVTWMLNDNVETNSTVRKLGVLEKPRYWTTFHACLILNIDVEPRTPILECVIEPNHRVCLDCFPIYKKVRNRASICVCFHSLLQVWPFKLFSLVYNTICSTWRTNHVLWFWGATTT